MADQQQNYPDSNGARWEGPARPAPADRPAFLDRTEPMSRQEREARGGAPSLDGMPGPRDRTSRLASHERGEFDSTAGHPAQHPYGPAASQWSPENAPTPPPAVGEPATGDPELAAVSGMDAPPESYRPAPPQPPQSAPPQPPQSGPPQSAPPQPPQAGPPQSGPPQSAPPQPPQAGPPQSAPPQPPEAAPRPPAAPHGPAYPENSAPGDLHEPTQMHNPVSNAPGAQQRGRAYPSQVADGVYQRNKSGLGSVIWVIALVVYIPIAYVMVRSLTSGGDVILSGAVASGVFALAGLPLTAYGLQASLDATPGPEGVSPLRAPYVYLVTGLVLILAAGMAAG